MPRNVVLPSELMDRTIDFLHDDTSSLETCSLVCRTWLPSCRFHKFWYMNARCRLHLLKKALQAFPYIGPYVRHMSVLLRKYKDIDCFISVTRSLPYLETLEVELDISDYTYDENEATFDIAAVSSVAQMSFLSEQTLNQMDVMARFLECFPNMEELRIECVDLKGAEEPLAALDEPHTKLLADTLARLPLKKLKVECDVYTVTCCLFLRPLGALRTLQVEYRNIEELLTLPTLLLALRGSPLLEELTIAIEDMFAEDFDVNEPACHLALRACPSVRVLRLYVTVDLVIDVVSMLSQLTAETVVGELQILLSCALDIYLDDETHSGLTCGLGNLALLLMRTQDATFRAVRITVGCVCGGSGHPVSPLIRRTMSNAFGSLLERNVTLVFQDHSRPRWATNEISETLFSHQETYAPTIGPSTF